MLPAILEFCGVEVWLTWKTYNEWTIENVFGPPEHMKWKENGLA